MDARSYLYVFARKWALIVGGAILGATLGATVALFSPAVVVASSDILVSDPGKIPTVVQLATSTAIHDMVVESTVGVGSSPTGQLELHAQNPHSTYLVRITASGTDGSSVVEYANGHAQALVAFADNDGSAVLGEGALSVTNLATTAQTDTSRQPIFMLIGGSILTSVILVVLVYLEYRRDSIELGLDATEATHGPAFISAKDTRLTGKARWLPWGARPLAASELLNTCKVANQRILIVAVDEFSFKTSCDLTGTEMVRVADAIGPAGVATRNSAPDCSENVILMATAYASTKTDLRSAAEAARVLGAPLVGTIVMYQ